MTFSFFTLTLLIMGWFFKRSINFGPIRINLSKSGIGASAGIPGVRIGVGPKGVRFTGNIPGTGIFYRKDIGKKKLKSLFNAATPPRQNNQP